MANGKPRYIYVIGPAYGPYKVGHSTDPAGRLKALNSANSKHLKVRYILQHDEAQRIEAVVHDHLGADRLNGEWFKASLKTIKATIRKAISGEIPASKGLPACNHRIMLRLDGELYRAVQELAGKRGASEWIRQAMRERLARPKASGHIAEFGDDGTTIIRHEPF
jgi:hypothetical protein